MAKSVALWALTVLVLQALYFYANAEDGKATVAILVPKHVSYGEYITVAGNADELCNWNCTACPNLRLTWNSGDNWLLVTELYTGKQYQYKAAVVHTNGSCTWQPGSNRELNIPSSFIGKDYFLNSPWDSSARNEDIFTVV